MAIYHLEAKVISRSSGRSACAASAYMSCSEIYNEYDGVQHDYTRKQGLVWEEVFLPPHAPSEWQDRSRLWNAVEEIEKSKDSRLAREFVVALPVELDRDSWTELLSEYIRDQFVSEGMCVDAAIHDTDGHNPHAHIMMTVRPLTGKGTWQNKTEKEYLCIRNGEERGFTASEFNSAKNDGWEKQYQYKVGKSKVYMPPSEAGRLGYERADKHPKSTRYGRQNPLTARWNSDEQLIHWREAWADAVNLSLERNGIEERIDHRSFKDLGITEQPTKHEGFIARDLEKRGIVSDRCEINRLIREDNRLLREIRKQVQKLAKAVSDAIPAIAEALETIRGNMIRLLYHLFDNDMQSKYLSGKIVNTKPVIEEYKSVKTEIRVKQTDRKDLMQQKKETSILKPLLHRQLAQQITELTEEIEELRTRKAQLQAKLNCSSEQGVKEYERYIRQMSENLIRLSSQRDSLISEIDSQADQFKEIMSRIDPDKSSELAAARLSIRGNIQNKEERSIRDTFGQRFDYYFFRRAYECADERLGEIPASPDRGKRSIKEKLSELQSTQPGNSKELPGIPVNRKHKSRILER